MTQDEVREALKNLSAPIFFDKHRDLLKPLTELAQLYLSISELEGMPKEKFIEYRDDFGAINRDIGYNQARYECLRAFMKAVSVEKLAELISGTIFCSEHTGKEVSYAQAETIEVVAKEVATAIHQSIVGKEG